MEAVTARVVSKEIAARYAGKIVEQCFKSKVLSADYVGGGSYGMAYKVAQDVFPDVVIVKVFTADGLCKSEAFSLIEMRSHTSVPVPEVYCVCYADNEIPLDCICMQCIEGRDAFFNFGLLFKPKKQKREFAEAVVNGLLELHSYTNEKFGMADNPVFDTWLDCYRPFAVDVMETARKMRAENRLEGYILNAMEKAYARFDDIFCEPVKEACFIHGDLNLMNIMVKPPFTLSGFIDPLESKFADREYDIFQFNNLTGKSFGLYDLYKSKYPVSGNCDVKCAFYALWNEVYCYIKSGTIFKTIMKPIVKNMNGQLKIFYGKK